MSEETGAPKPNKLKLSLESPPTEKPSAPANSETAQPAPQEAPQEAPQPAPQEGAEPKARDLQDPFRDITEQASLKKTALKPKPSSVPVKKSLPPELPEQPTPQSDDGSSEKLETAIEQLPPEEQKQGSPITSILIICILFFILGAAGFGIWYLLNSDTSSAEPATTEVVATDKPASTGGPISKAQAMIATVDSTTLPEVIESETVLPNAKLTSNPGPKTRAESAPQPTAPTASDLNEKVTQFLTSATIGAVKVGARPRMMLNGESYSIGDVIDSDTGLSFMGTKDKRLVFKDQNGIFYLKSF
jgi:hypothetical protein